MRAMGFGIVLCCLMQVADAAQAPALPAKVESAIRARLDADQYSALTVVVIDGDQAAIYPFGKLSNGTAPAADTVFEIGSVTKTLTATLLADLVRRGKVKLDAPVASLLPGFRVPSRGGKAITLESLATQSSGLPRLPTNLALSPDTKDPYARYDAAQLKQFLAGYTLPSDPGAHYEYSNTGFGLLGHALGEKAGHGYAAALKSRVIDPLGMRDTVLAPEKVRAGRLADGHDNQGRPVPHWHFQVFAPTGGVLSSARDMQRYLQANMGSLKTPLYPAMQLAQQPRADTATTGERIGLAWMTRHTEDGDVVWHNGMTGGFASFIGFTQDRKHGVAVLSNRSESVDDIGFALLVPSTTLAPPHVRVTLPTETLDEYVGRYELAPSVTMAITRQGDRLYEQVTGQDAIELSASAKDEFHIWSLGVGISFQRGADGKVRGLVLHQHGDHPAPRMPENNEAAGKRP